MKDDKKLIDELTCTLSAVTEALEQEKKKYNEALERAKMYQENAKEAGDFSAVARYENIFPELHESEDEKIRKRIYSIIYHNDALLDKEKCLAWLEKQKEQKEKATSTLAKVLEDFAEKFRRLLKTKGIDYVPTNNFWNNIAIAYSKQEKLDFDKWYDDLMIPEEKQKKQKPNEHSFDYLAGKYAGYAEGKQDALKEQKPAEWSRDDIGNEQEIIRCIENTRDNDICPDKTMYNDLISWFKSLCLQSKQEWSEEDNIGWDEAFACVTKAENAAKNEEELQNAITADKWLKEIKFKYCLGGPKWSREDERKLEDVIYWFSIFCDKNQSKPEMRESLDWLKSLRPHWKPSEEQVHALERAIIRINTVDDIPLLTELRDKLKAL